MTFREAAGKNRTIDKEDCLRWLQSEKKPDSYTDCIA